MALRSRLAFWYGDSETGPVSSSQTETKVALRYRWSSEQFSNWNKDGAANSSVSSSQTETEVVLQMVQRAVHKLKKRWRYRWSSEQFKNWNRGGATHGPMSSSQTETEVALQMVQWAVQKLKQRWRATDGPVSSSQTEIEIALRTVQRAVSKLKQRWRYERSSEQFTNGIWGGAIGWSKEQFLNWNRGSTTDGPVSSSQTVTEVVLQMVQWAVIKLK